MRKKQLAFKALSMLGIEWMFRTLNRNKTLVLMYHGVTEDDNILASNNWLHVRQSDFRKQMLFLKDRYDIIPLSEISEPHKGKKQRAVITFDDGFVNNYHVAFPILKELNIPATIFLVTAHIDTKHIFWYDRLWCAFTGRKSMKEIEDITQAFKALHPHKVDQAVQDLLGKSSNINEYSEEAISETFGILTSEQIKEMSGSGLIEFGCHTHRHEILTEMAAHEVHETIGDSVYWGAHYLDLVLSSFCSPNGSYAPHHLDIFRKHHFKQAVTTKCGFFTPNTNLLEIPRMPIGQNTTMLEYSILTSGLLCVLLALKERCCK